MTRTEETYTKAMNLVSTSVDDLLSSLGFYSYLNQSDIEVIRYGLIICERRKEKTKAILLRRKLTKMEKLFASTEKS